MGFLNRLLRVLDERFPVGWMTAAEASALRRLRRLGAWGSIAALILSADQNIVGGLELTYDEKLSLRALIVEFGSE